jgi:hypothetical protein
LPTGQRRNCLVEQLVLVDKRVRQLAAVEGGLDRLGIVLRAKERRHGPCRPLLASPGGEQQRGADGETGIPGVDRDEQLGEHRRLANQRREVGVVEQAAADAQRVDAECRADIRNELEQKLSDPALDGAGDLERLATAAVPVGLNELVQPLPPARLSMKPPVLVPKK